MKKTASLFLAAVLALSLVRPATATTYYTDVPEGKWYTEAVNYVTEHGLFAGIGGGLFDPSGQATRAMFVTVLSRVAGVDVSSAPDAGFTDMPKGKWYSKAIDWAYAEGYADSTGEAAFSPNAPITREEIAVILSRYCTGGCDDQMRRFGNKSYTNGPAHIYADAAEISEEAINSVGFMHALGIMEGSGGYFYPKSNLNRAETAAIFMRLDRLVNGEPSFTLDTHSFYIETSVYDKFDETKSFGKITGTQHSEYGDYTLYLDSSYYLKISDPTVISIGSSGLFNDSLCNPPKLAEDAAPVTAYIEVINLLDGTRDRVEVTVAPKDPHWAPYVVDDEYIARYAAEVLRLVNEVRAEAGVAPVIYSPEEFAQEAANLRSEQLVTNFSHAQMNIPEIKYGLKTSRAENVGKMSISYDWRDWKRVDESPELMAACFVKMWENSPGHYANLVREGDWWIAVGFHLEPAGLAYSSLNFYLA